MIIVKRYHFYAAHRNPEAGLKCSRIHGHTYDVVCHFNMEMQENGLTMLFADIDKIVEPIVKQYDHYFLLYENDPLCEILTLMNEDFIELPFQTSAENLAVYLFVQIKRELPIFRIELSETKTSTIIYEPKS